MSVEDLKKRVTIYNKKNHDIYAVIFIQCKVDKDIDIAIQKVETVRGEK